MAITSSFQLQIAHRLKHWIVDFLSFKMVYSMHQLAFRKCSKSGWYDCHQEYALWQILFASCPCIPDLLMAKDFQALVLHVSDLPIALPKIPHNSPQSRIALVIKKAIKIPKLNTNWLEVLAKVLNLLIGLKGNNYYSKVFKRVNYKLWNSTFWIVISYVGLTLCSNLIMSKGLDQLGVKIA